MSDKNEIYLSSSSVETKKFLDYDGIKYLWSKINMNDYPNNQTLLNVINAIDETKADRSELEDLIIKHDIEANWDLQTDFIPDKGEFILYDIDENFDYERIKVGDGITPVTNLPFYLASEINLIKEKLEVLDQMLDVEVDSNLNILVFTRPLSI